jgi:hypothetical protein
MRMASQFLGLAVIGVLVSASVSQAGTFSLVGVGDFNKQSWSNTGFDSDSQGSKLGLGGGFLYDMGVASWTSLEIGGLYINRQVDDTTLGTITSTHAIQVPVLLRWWLHPMFSIAGGAYYARGIGNVSNEDSSGNVQSTSSFAASGLLANDFGLTGSVALRLPITMSMRLLIDGRYNYGLSNVSTNSSGSETIKNRDEQILIGFQFSMRSNR